ncbi:MAG: tyrosine--tRNA ligase [Oscillospiraceae bacterium]|nr:tyrosine--tRNA ligase [Oscillospiraceae bacterium]
MTLFEELKRRGLIAQANHEKEIEELLNNESVSFYIGFDATADSLHIGHYLVITVMKRMQLAGHKPFALLGTATTMIGDPTGKTDMRKMLTPEEIEANAGNFIRQMSKFIDFSDGKAESVKNGDWFGDMKYLEFLRNIGRYFSVNQMLTAECFKSRLEGKGLSFLEFNYMLLQSYDFLHLYKTKNVKLQLGGDDQWSNMLGGTDLVRRIEQKSVYAMTFTLLGTKEGNKMGKTERGALWLDPEKCPPYDFYQYWRNVDDGDVMKCLKMLTFLPIEEIEEMESTMQGAALNEAKEILAFELTKTVHSEEEAVKCREAARKVFGGGGASDDMPSTSVNEEELTIIDLLVLTGLAPSKSEGRRLVTQGGISVDEVKIENPNQFIRIEDFVIIKKGKKVFHKAVRA